MILKVAVPALLMLAACAPPSADPAKTGAAAAAPEAHPDTLSERDDVPPPQAALPEAPRTIARAFLVGPWTAKGADCARPDFDISPVPGPARLTVQAELDGVAHTGDVRHGEDAALVFEEAGRTLQLEKRRAEALAVLPPDSGPVKLGDVTIEGDGVVFVACPG